jgi:hypothetical protein
VYILVGPRCISACYKASKENEKEILEGNGLRRLNEIGDFVSRYTVRKVEKLVLITQHELAEQPSDPPTVLLSRFYGTMEDARL